ncbi:MAG TPA: hypothetical protein VJ023_06045 [Pyrinomonadaceae bacterium]|nr:hypothetical protein [Pyrinomonadaceae bacterium]
MHWLLLLCLLLSFCVGAASAQSPSTTGERTDNETEKFDKDGLTFDYQRNWTLSYQSNASAQQLVLTEPKLDAQIMIVALRGEVTNTEEEEHAKTALIEPSINRLLKQYYDAGIEVQRVAAKGGVGDLPAEGAQLRFSVDGQAGTTDVFWLVINQRLLQMFLLDRRKLQCKASPVGISFEAA